MDISQFINLAMLQGLVRHVLSGLGGTLVASGVITGSEEQDILGGVLALVAVAWSFYQKHQQKQAVTAATENK